MSRWKSTTYKLIGSYNVYCDRCAHTVKAHQAVKEVVTNLIVCRRCADERPDQLQRYLYNFVEEIRPIYNARDQQLAKNSNGMNYYNPNVLDVPTE